MACTGDGVEAKFVRFAVGIFTLRNDADALPFDVFELGITAGEVEGDVLHPTNATVSNQGIVLRHRAKEGRLGLVGVDRNVGVGLLLGSGCRGHGLRSGGAGRGHRSRGGFLAGW